MNLTGNKTLQLAGLNFQEPSISVSGDVGVGVGNAVAAAQQGTIGSVSGNTGTVTMGSSGHTVTTGARVDVFWTASGVQKVRYGMIVGTVAGTAVPLTNSGAGDNLPGNGTTVYLSLPILRSFNVIGNNLAALVLSTTGTGPGQFIIRDNATTVLLPVTLGANKVYDWYTGSGRANPLVGVTAFDVYMSNGDPVSACTLQIGAVASA
jgi:hypothetical protein